MSVRDVGQATVLFAATNIDDIVVVALFFAQGAGHRGATLRIAVGQYLGFALILALSVAGAFGATLLPESAIPYLGLLPLMLGLRAAWHVWRDRHGSGEDGDYGVRTANGPGVLGVAAVALANGGDNIGVYVPVFATAGTESTGVILVVSLALLAVLIYAGRLLATRTVVARALSRWGHLLMPVVLITIGLVILAEGHAFGS